MQLADEASSIIPDIHLRRVARDVAFFLLTNQYICIGDGRSYKVIHGSGMDLMHSGGISDAAFYTLAEEPLYKPEYMSECNVKHVWRCKDDLLMLWAR